ncbi:hypothetical protein ASD19_09735 [Microbacterium sp. Root53]|uniref:hypothetical protein n=1 Tax=Microbacterium sp. Root53 TaxID=1736553 RepID=UPI0007140357|nr:hypothetical protein [Microbacterium sp. Root53]KQY96821.1 hypothetical protein ASD19_09735 [Microbacterium sp. Root53]
MLMRGPDWYGADPAWFVPFEREAFRLFGRSLRVEYAWDVLHHGTPCMLELSCGTWARIEMRASRTEAVPRRRYLLDGVDVVGRNERVPVVVEFRPQRYFAGGELRDGRDFPFVYAGQMPGSPHRYEDGALCLYYPEDPAEQRWTADKNLAALIVLVQDHLFLEDTYADTGAWIAPEAEHGFTEEAKRTG